MAMSRGSIPKTTTGPGANYRKTKSGAGMTAKGVKAYRRANPGSKLKTAVTGKVKKGSAAAKRRKSYCARSLGQLKKASAKTRNDPNSRIRQARRRWKCQTTVWVSVIFAKSVAIVATAQTGVNVRPANVMIVFMTNKKLKNIIIIQNSSYWGTQ